MSRNISSATSVRPKPVPRQAHLPQNSKKDVGLLRLPSAQTVPIPIPPSLLRSAYFTSRVFQRPPSLPSTPTADDEAWLRDTVPIPAEHRTLEESRCGSLQAAVVENLPEVRGDSEVAMQTGLRRGSLSRNPFRIAVPSSPPLVRARKKYPEGSCAQQPSETQACRQRTEDYFNV